MIQDPNPIDDVEQELFFEWFDIWRNGDSAEKEDPHKLRAFLSCGDLMRIWIEGLVIWHLRQMEYAPPPDLYEYHSKELKNCYTQLENMPKFQPTYTMR